MLLDDKPMWVQEQVGKLHFTDGNQREGSMMIDLSFLREVMSTKVKSKVNAKSKCNTCLICDASAAKGLRGLCKSHYYQFNHAWRKQKTKRARDEFEVKQIKAGRVLASVRGKHGKPNVFLDT